MEVLKGPTSALYASADAGGLINYVTKEPKRVTDLDVQFRGGNYAQKYGNIDFSRPSTDKLFSRGAPSANGPFAPETGHQLEIGAKSEVLNGRLSLTTAYFQIDKRNVLRPIQRLALRETMRTPCSPQARPEARESSSMPKAF